jgi:nitrite reductase/ring-hydroxylating ferredoxin subunit
MKNDIPSNKGKLEDAKYAVEHSSTADKNRIFTAYMYKDKQQTINITLPTNESFTINDVGPSIVSISGICVHNQGDMSYSLLGDEEWIRRVCQLFNVVYLIPAVTVKK